MPSEKIGNPSDRKLFLRKLLASGAVASAALAAACTPSESEGHEPQSQPTPSITAKTTPSQGEPGAGSQTPSPSKSISEVPVTETPGIETTEPVEIETAEPSALEFPPLREWAIDEELESTLLIDWDTMSDIDRLEAGEKFFEANVPNYVSPEELKQLDTEGVTRYFLDRLEAVADLGIDTSQPEGLPMASNLLDVITREDGGVNPAKERLLESFTNYREASLDENCLEDEEVLSLCEHDRKHFMLDKIIAISNQSYPTTNKYGSSYSAIAATVQTKDPTIESLMGGVGCYPIARIMTFTLDDGVDGNAYTIRAREIRAREVFFGTNVDVSYDGAQTITHVGDLVDHTTITCS